MEKILAPSYCPSCGEFLKWENHILYCRNINCGSQSQKKIEHFGKTLKIKGLGPAAIEKLELDNPGDLYFLTITDIEDAGINTGSAAGIRGVPTVIIYKKGQEVSRKVGGVPESHMKEFLDENI